MGRGTTTIYMKQENALIVKMEADQLGFNSVEEFLMLLIDVRKRLKYSKLDLFCLRDYGQIPKVELLTPEDLEKMGYKQVGVPFEEQLGKVICDVQQKFEQTIPVEVKVKPKTEKRILQHGPTALVITVEDKPESKKKQKKQEKTPESTENMPTSEQFFKGDK